MTYAEALEAMDQSRQQIYQWLDSLSDSDFDRMGRHPTLAILSLEQFLTLMSAHELAHAADLEAFYLKQVSRQNPITGGDAAETSQPADAAS